MKYFKDVIRREFLAVDWVSLLSSEGKVLMKGWIGGPQDVPKSINNTRENSALHHQRWMSLEYMIDSLHHHSYI